MDVLGFRHACFASAPVLEVCYLLLATCHLLLTSYSKHCLPRVLLATYLTGLTPCSLLLATYYSLLATYYLPLTTYCSPRRRSRPLSRTYVPLTNYHLPLTADCSLLQALEALKPHLAAAHAAYAHGNGGGGGSPGLGLALGRTIDLIRTTTLTPRASVWPSVEP